MTTLSASVASNLNQTVKPSVLNVNHVKQKINLPYRPVGTTEIALVDQAGNINRQYIQWFSDLQRYAGDRDRLSKAGAVRREWLANFLKQGLFTAPKWSTVLVKQTNQIFRANGGHSSLMLLDQIDCGQIGPNFPIKAIIDEWECDTEQDLPEVFSLFDQVRLARSNADNLNAHKAVHPTLASLAAAATGYCTAGLAYDLQVVRGGPAISKDDKVRLVHHYPSFISWASKYMTTKQPGLKRNGTIAAMHETFCIDPAAADVFWNLVQNDSATLPDDPTRLLSKHLDGKTTGKTINVHEDYVKSVYAWNHARKHPATGMAAGHVGYAPMTTSLRYYKAKPGQGLYFPKVV